MTKRLRPSRLWLMLPALWGSAGFAFGETSAQGIAAVFSSETGPYREARAGLQQELGTSVPTFVLSQGEPTLPESTRVVVAFGSRAALRGYPNQVLVYAMAPGAEIQSKNAIKISMEPSAAKLLASLRKIHPRLKRLGILWESPRFKDYVDELNASAGPSGLTLEIVAVKDSADVPEHLRRLYGKIDAVWLLPDPLLLNGASLPVFLEFSRANKVPLYVPTAGLVDQGATASVGPTFREMGRLAGAAARKALRNAPQENDLHADAVEIVVNKEVAARLGLQIPEDALQKADKAAP